MSEEKANPEKEIKKADKPKIGKLAVLQIRGLIGVSGDIKDTLRMLNLQKKNSLVIIPNNQSNKGMLFKCKDYITYGEVSDETIKDLDAKRKTDKKFYSLHPPRGGFEKKGIKKSFNRGGALGYRGDKINILIKKMI